MLGHAVILQHVQEGRLSSIVKSWKIAVSYRFMVLFHVLEHTEEEKLSGLFPQTEIVENARKPIPDEHLGCKIMIF